MILEGEPYQNDSGGRALSVCEQISGVERSTGSNLKSGNLTFSN